MHDHQLLLIIKCFWTKITSIFIKCEIKTGSVNEKTFVIFIIVSVC